MARLGWQAGIATVCEWSLLATPRDPSCARGPTSSFQGRRLACRLAFTSVSTGSRSEARGWVLRPTRSPPEAATAAAAAAAADASAACCALTEPTRALRPCSAEPIMFAICPHEWRERDALSGKAMASERASARVGALVPQQPAGGAEHGRRAPIPSNRRGWRSERRVDERSRRREYRQENSPTSGAATPSARGRGGGGGGRRVG